MTYQIRKIHEHVMGMMDGKLGNLARNSRRNSRDLCLNMEEGAMMYLKNFLRCR